MTHPSDLFFVFGAPESSGWDNRLDSNIVFSWAAALHTALVGYAGYGLRHCSFRTQRLKTDQSGVKKFDYKLGKGIQYGRKGIFRFTSKWSISFSVLSNFTKILTWGCEVLKKMGKRPKLTRLLIW